MADATPSLYRFAPLPPRHPQPRVARGRRRADCADGQGLRHPVRAGREPAAGVSQGRTAGCGLAGTRGRGKQPQPGDRGAAARARHRRQRSPLHGHGAGARLSVRRRRAGGRRLRAVAVAAPRRRRADAAPRAPPGIAPGQRRAIALGALLFVRRAVRGGRVADARNAATLAAPLAPVAARRRWPCCRSARCLGPARRRPRTGPGRHPDHPPLAFEALQVRALASSQRMAGTALDAKAAGRELDAAYVVEGTTQRVGDQVRINARLVSVAEGRTVWADTFDAPIDRVFTLQDRMGDSVTSALQLAPVVRAGARAEPLRWRGRPGLSRLPARLLPAAPARRRTPARGAGRVPRSDRPRPDLRPRLGGHRLRLPRAGHDRRSRSARDVPAGQGGGRARAGDRPGFGRGAIRPRASSSSGTTGTGRARKRRCGMRWR